MLTPNKKNFIVKVRQLEKIYHLGETQVSALCGVDLDLEAGAFTALVGASGSGKSTLLNIIGCIDVPSSGEVWIDDINVQKLNDQEISRLRNQKIGFIFQSFNLIPVLNVFENIELPLLLQSQLTRENRQERILRSLSEVGLSQWVHHKPEQLSGGQRQRVAIARALATQPRLVLADEPTANLDSKNSHMIIDLMLELNQKHQVTFLFSTHDEKLMSRVTHLMHIEDGKIVK